MTNQSFPITPSTQLVGQWLDKFYGQSANGKITPGKVSLHIAAAAAQWGADQELEACCEWLRSKDILEPAIDALRADRRSKPPSLKEHIVAAITEGDKRTALLLLNEALPND
jgi:hypothetical protein